MRCRMAVLVTLLACGTLAAAIFGGAPYEKWENGGYGYLVLGNSLSRHQGFHLPSLTARGSSSSGYARRLRVPVIPRP